VRGAADAQRCRARAAGAFALIPRGWRREAVAIAEGRMPML
jgi:hypothetical protein